MTETVHRVAITGLDPLVDERDLTEVLTKLNVTPKQLKVERKGPKSLCKAWVIFESAADADKGLSLSGLSVRNQAVEVKLEAAPPTPAPTSTPSSTPASAPAKATTAKEPVKASKARASASAPAKAPRKATATGGDKKDASAPHSARQKGKPSSENPASSSPSAASGPKPPRTKKEAAANREPGVTDKKPRGSPKPGGHHSQPAAASATASIPTTAVAARPLNPTAAEFKPRAAAAVPLKLSEATFTYNPTKKVFLSDDSIMVSYISDKSATGGYVGDESGSLYMPKKSAPNYLLLQKLKCKYTQGYDSHDLKAEQQHVLLKNKTNVLSRCGGVIILRDQDKNYVYLKRNINSMPFIKFKFLIRQRFQSQTTPKPLSWTESLPKLAMEKWEDYELKWVTDPATSLSAIFSERAPKKFEDSDAIAAISQDKEFWDNIKQKAEELLKEIEKAPTGPKESKIPDLSDWDLPNGSFGFTQVGLLWRLENPSECALRRVREESKALSEDITKDLKSLEMVYDVPMIKKIPATMTRLYGYEYTGDRRQIGADFRKDGCVEYGRWIPVDAVCSSPLEKFQRLKYAITAASAMVVPDKKQ